MYHKFQQSNIFSSYNNVNSSLVSVKCSQKFEAQAITLSVTLLLTQQQV